MAEVVPIKVHVIWREDESPEIRRSELVKEAQLSFVKFTDVLIGLFPDLLEKLFKLYWIDSDGDKILISSDQELTIAASEICPPKPLSLYVQCLEDDEEPDSGRPKSSTLADAGDEKDDRIICDNCEKFISGYRYKCIVCEDFDLCQKCENSGAHPEHCTVRLVKPEMKKNIVKLAVKKSRSLQKHLKAEAERASKREYALEKERQRADAFHRNLLRGRLDKANGWFDTFSSYMNEFTNLAGDTCSDPETKKKEAQPGPAPKTQSEHATPQRNCDAQRELDTLKEYIARMTMKKEEQKKEAKKVKSEKKAKSKEAKKLRLPYNCSFSRECTTGPDGSWTVIESERDDSVRAEFTEAFTPEESSSDEIPEQRKTTKLYPPLNKSTAVLDPAGPSKAGNEKPKEQKPEQQPLPEKKPEPEQEPLPEKKPEPEQTPKPAPHPSAKIEGALQQMMNMGFTNDGGWLTQLLENKKGDIAAVLDILTPVNVLKK